MRYEIGALLGRGGMAQVHEGIARGAHGFTRRVAVKRLLADASSDPSVVRMFLDEARIASRLEHAGIVSILDFGDIDGVPFQVLELVDGKDAGFLVRQALARGDHMPVEIAMHIAAEVAHALAHAHEARNDRGEPLDIVHRDVKPSNVLVSRSGDVKLGDFGIARARERCAQTTGFVVKGTPAFMAPEQLIGGAVDARTDVFALGCTLHALAVGHSPLVGEHGRSSLLLGNELPLSPSLPDDTRKIVERAVKRRPEDRYPSARAMAADLGAALAKRLRTDAKSTLLVWLATAGSPPPLRPAPTTEILSTIGAEDDKRFGRTIVDAPRKPSAAKLFAVGLGASVVLGGGAILATFIAAARSNAAAVDARPPAASSVPAPADADGQPDVRAIDASDTSADASPPARAVRPSMPAYDPHCLCQDMQAGESLCDPSETPVPVCRCGEAANPASSMCWTAITETSAADSCTTEKALPAGTREGDPCIAYPRRGRSAGASTVWSTEPAQQGRVTHCIHCRTTLRVPRQPGATCSGLQRSSGKRVEGRIECRAEFDTR